jgi:hypothetical protein
LFRVKPVRKDVEQKSRTEPATASGEELDAIWPWALLVLADVITAAWAIAVGWAAVALVRRLVG